MYSKQVIAALLLANVSADKHADSVKLVEGILNGAIGATKFGDIDTCVTNFEEAFDDIGAGITDVEKQSLQDVLKGLSLIGKGMSVSAASLRTCKSEIQSGDIDKLDKMADTLMHPDELVFNIGKDIIVNKTQIYKDLAAAELEYKIKAYYLLG